MNADKSSFRVLLAALLALSLSGASSRSAPPAIQDAGPRPREGEVGLLKLLGLEAPPESIDYVQNKTQFQLHTLLTEQRHPKTWNLSEQIAKDTTAGLRMLFSVDEDIAARLDALASETKEVDEAAGAVEEAIQSGNKIYIYGCGATGRLAKQMESSFWRPFWKKVKGQDKVWAKLGGAVPEDIEERLIGEMTGADRALISSLEGFEDLQLIGRLQLRDRGVRKGDVVICITEGGETSSVIGTVLGALDQWKTEPGYDPAVSRNNLYFVYNNPDDKLLPFLRSRMVIEEPGITKINLATGPQSITGSTRMQATTIETYVVGTILQAAARRMLGKALSPKEMGRIGFEGEARLGENFRGFARVLESVKAAIPAIVPFTDIETAVYQAGRFSTYFADDGLITVFIDSTERSPTFRLFPLDTVREPKRRSWIQVWTGAPTINDAWLAFLGRPFRGLDPELYRKPFEEEIEDPYLRTAALESLKRAGNDQADLYDFSFSSFNLKNRGPGKGDLGVAVCLSPEEGELERGDSYIRRFIDLFAKNGARVVLVIVTGLPDKDVARIEKDLRENMAGNAAALHVVPVRVDAANDPFGLKLQIAAKMLLNAHSTAIMTKLGKVIGNTMTNVSPSNLKLIGRATFLIQSHVNDTLSRPQWVRTLGRRKPISYGEANAVLFDSIAYLKGKREMTGQTAEVGLSIIRILESLKQKRGLTSDEALEILRNTGLSAYLSALTK
jgi:N-acetylmuramic acid 6-phosphate (MurNAc-6-P) etherase